MNLLLKLFEWLNTLLVPNVPKGCMLVPNI